MLATARLGAIHSVVFGGFASNELAKRLDDAKPKVVVSASCGVEPSRVVAYKPLLDKAIEIATHKPESCVVLQRPMAAAELQRGRDHDWAQPHGVTQSRAGSRRTACRVAATDPLYILYTSGSTGTPKGVVRDNGGHMVALIWTMKNLYGVKPGEVFWSASDIGWVVGHSIHRLTGRSSRRQWRRSCTRACRSGRPTPGRGGAWSSEHKVDGAVQRADRACARCASRRTREAR